MRDRSTSPRLKRIALPAVISVCLAAASAGLLSACGGTSSSGSDVKVAAIFPGPLQGNLYNEVHYRAMKAAAKKVGHIQLHPVFNIHYTNQATQTTEQLFQQGADIVIDVLAAGPLFYNGCKQFPDKKCLTFARLEDPADPPASNLKGYYTDDPLIYYAEGVAAGKITKTGTLGFVSAFNSPFDTNLVNAYALGCQSVRPDCKVRNVYINSFYNPPKAIEATNTLVDSGADVINHFLDDPSPVVQAQKRGVFGFGLYTDYANKAPDAWVSGELHQAALTKIYENEFQELVDGTWKPGGMDWGTATAPNTQMAPFGKDIPASARTAAQSALSDIKAGKNPFTGPIYDASGKVRIKKGDAIGYRSTYMWNKWTWPVRGVIGL
jgi:basic membrane protein A and related proteins